MKRQCRLQIDRNRPGYAVGRRRAWMLYAMRYRLGSTQAVADATGYTKAYLRAKIRYGRWAMETHHECDCS